jgi:hypothetical protein
MRPLSGGAPEIVWLTMHGVVPVISMSVKGACHSGLQGAASRVWCAVFILVSCARGCKCGPQRYYLQQGGGCDGPYCGGGSSALSYSSCCAEASPACAEFRVVTVTSMD